MKPSPPPPRLASNAVEIINPPQGPSGPLPYPITVQTGCKINANGKVVDPAAQTIVSVRGWVNSQANVQTGTANGLNWEVTAGKAVTGTTNTFYVEVKYTTVDGPVMVTAPRQFIATGYSGSCGATLMALSQQRPVARLMPRYYKVTVDEQSLPSLAQGPSSLLAEQLGRNAIYLAYDVALSTASEPVWRDINLPASSGHWTLRVRQSDGRLAGELLLQRLSETEVDAPVVLSCASWTFAGKNVLAEDSVAAAVVVEPA